MPDSALFLQIKQLFPDIAPIIDLLLIICIASGGWVKMKNICSEIRVKQLIKEELDGKFAILETDVKWIKETQQEIKNTINIVRENMIKRI